MSHTALIAFAPLVTLDRINDPKWQRPGRTIYDRGALSMLPGKTSIPLLVDHDEDRAVGSVREFSKMEWTDGPWLVAHATIERVPYWLRKNDTKASFEYIGARQSHWNGCEITRHGWVTEVSLISPTNKPAEPLAKVLGLWEDKIAPRAAATPAPVVRTPVVASSRRTEKARGKDREMEELRRRCDAGGWENLEQILEAYKLELGYSSGLHYYRPRVAA